MFRPVIVIWILFFAANVAKGQDMHFTQFFAAPLLTSPSNTGFYSDDWRIGGNYKNQWPWGSSLTNRTYRTFSFYGDARMMHKRVKKRSWLGIGGVALIDRAGDGDLATTKVAATAAYHFPLDFYSRFWVSVGGGMAYIQKSVDMEKLYFNSQWDDNRFNTATPSGEPIGAMPIRYPDVILSSKLTWRKSERLTLTGDVALWHVNRPKESFLNTANRLSMRPVVSAGADYALNSKWSLLPAIAWMNQRGANEFLPGMMAAWNPNPDRIPASRIYAGGWYRYKDALALLVGYKIYNVRVLVNYDINLSRLTPASGGAGGFELSIVYTKKVQEPPEIKGIPCPRM